MVRIILDDFVIRSLLESDFKDIAKHANSKEIWRNLRDYFPYPYTENDAKMWLQCAIEQPNTTFAIVVEDEVVGSIGIALQGDVHRKSAEIGYWLGAAHWGQGIMTKAVLAIIDYSFENFDIVRLYAYVFEWNIGSRRVLQKAGFSLEGILRKAAFKDNQLIDQYVYGLVLM